jgi:hypothetical protein
MTEDEASRLLTQSGLKAGAVDDKYQPAKWMVDAVRAEREACAKVFDAKAAKWHKEAQRHLPRHRSDQAARDLERAAVCEVNAATIRARAPRPNA